MTMAGPVRLLWLLALVLAVPMTSSCVGPWSKDSELQLVGVTWMDDGWVYAIDRRLDAPDVLMRLDRDTAPEQVELSLPGCLSLQVDALARVDTNILALAGWCGTAGEGTDIFALDVATGSARHVANVDRAVRDMAWTSDFRVGYLLSDCGILIKLEDGSEVPFAEPVTVDGVRWRLDRSGDCFAGGDAQSPFVVGQHLFLFVSGLAANERNYAKRQLAPTAVARMLTPDGPLTVIAEGFSAVGDLAATADGMKIVVSGVRGDVASCWLIDIASGRITDLTVEKPLTISISPFGGQAAVSHGSTVEFLNI